MTARSEHSWNRRCALEFTGHIFSGLGSLSRSDDMEAVFEWAMAALEPPQPDEPPVDGLAAAHSFGQDEPEQIRIPEHEDPEVAANKLRVVAEELGAARRRFVNKENPEGRPPELPVPDLRPFVQTAMRALVSGPSPRSVPGSPADVPPRNVPIEGDGSMSVPVYRFYHVATPAVYETIDDGTTDGQRVLAAPPGYQLWREDTRNFTLRWSKWVDDMDAPGGHWEALAAYDNPPADWVARLQRLRADELAQYNATPETRYDTEGD